MASAPSTAPSARRSTRGPHRAPTGDDGERRPWWRATPTVLWASGVLLLALLSTSCVAAVLSETTRSATTSEVLARAEPLAADAARVYRALADADTAVIRGGLAAGEEPAAQQRYEDDVAEAAAGLAAAAGRADDPATVDRVAFLGAQLPVYTGLVERARAGASSDGVSGADYLASASPLLQDSMLPVAASLQQRQSRELAQSFDAVGAVPVVTLVAVAATLVALIVVQVVVACRVRRVLNPGLVVATVLVVVGVGWWVVAGALAGQQLDGARSSGRAVSEALVPAQIAALRARATEGANLVHRRAGDDDHTFEDRMEILDRGDGAGGALGASRTLATDPEVRTQVAVAVAVADAYDDAHTRVDQALASGRDGEAIALSVSRDDGTSPLFDQLDGALNEAVTTERDEFAVRMAGAQADREGMVAGAVVLGAAGVLAAGWGLWRRLDEYENPARTLRDTSRASS